MDVIVWRWWVVVEVVVYGEGDGANDDSGRWQ